MKLIHYLISFTGTNIFDRHAILVNSIGAFPEEIEAYVQIQWMIGLSYSLLVLLTTIQIVSFYLYNDRFHPFALIVRTKEKSSQGPMNHVNQPQQSSDEDNIDDDDAEVTSKVNDQDDKSEDSYETCQQSLPDLNSDQQ